MQGRYVKNGEITEIYIGNGITELLPERTEIQIIPMKPKRRRIRRRIERMKLPDLMLLSASIGMTAAAMTIAMIEGNMFSRVWVFAALIVDAAMLYQNFLRRG